MNNLRILNNTQLKIIACIAMVIDHAGYTLIWYSPRWGRYYQLFRDIGRCAFPIFCFLLVEGFLHTRSRKKYARNMLLFAIISELPFDLAFNINRSLWYSQNVFFTLLIGLLVIWGIEHFRGKVPLQALVWACGMLVAWQINCDYDWKGILLITVLYLFYRDRAALTVIGSLCLLWEWKAIFAFISINLYNGQRGNLRGKWTKYAFYVFYPAHLLILTWLRYRLFAISPTFL